MTHASNKIFFPGLNGIRFLAASAAVVTHIELAKKMFGFGTGPSDLFKFNLLGWVAVNCFFVLSGFLITYLLFAENGKTGTVGVRNFYIRRILRIWPLYYFLVMLGFLVFPNIAVLDVPVLSDQFLDGYGAKLMLFALLVPQLARPLYGDIPHIGHLWSVGVEELFYLFWPLLMKYSKNFMKTILATMILIIVGKTAIFLFGHFFVRTESFSHIKFLVAVSRFECMTFGALGAYLVFTKHKVLARLHNPLLLGACVALVPILLFLAPSSFIHDEALLGVNGVLINSVSSIIFMVIIANVSANPHSFLKLENAVFNLLGKVSYGIYMYHVFIVVLVFKIVARFTIQVPGHFGIMSNIFIYIATFFFTIGLSHLSYQFFEKRFIEMKVRFSQIVSGDLAKKSVPQSPLIGSPAFPVDGQVAAIEPLA